MTDPTYTPLVYHAQGGAQVVVASGGSIKLETGGQIIPNSGTQASTIADLATAATNAQIATAFNALLVAVEGAGILATS
ncbi:MAG: hypothetical protein ABUJ92_00380 [Desulfobacterales bacterium]